MRTRESIARTLEQWLYPCGDHTPGEVARIDIGRIASGAAREATRTTALLLSPPLDNRVGWRSGIRIRMDTVGREQREAVVDLIEGIAAVPNMGSAELCEERWVGDTYRQPLLTLLGQGGIAEVKPPTAVHAVVPLVADCSRVLAGLAAGTEAKNWTAVPISP